MIQEKFSLMATHDYSVKSTNEKPHWWNKIPNSAWILVIGGLLLLLGLFPGIVGLIGWLFACVIEGIAGFFGFWDIRNWGWGRWLTFLTFVTAALWFLNARRN